MHIIERISNRVRQQLARTLGYGTVFTRFEYASQGVEAFPSSPITRLNPMHLDRLHWKFKLPAPGVVDNSEPAMVYEFQDVRVAGDAGIIVDLHKTAWISSRWSEPFIRQRLGKVILGTPHPLSGKVLSLAARQSANNYFHWMTDVLPRLAMLEKAGHTLHSFSHVVVSSHHTQFQRETLEHLGVPIDRCISLSQTTCVHADQLVWPAEPCLSGNVPSWIVDFLRKSFQVWMRPDPRSPQKIFIGRKPGGKRQLLNQPEVQSLLVQQGITTYYLDDMRVQEQVSLFFNAELIIAVHGAALTNLVFCRETATIIELFPINYVNQCYWTLASHVGMRYGYLLGMGEDQTTTENHLMDGDFSISLSDLDTLIDRTIKNQSIRADHLQGDVNQLNHD